MLDLGLKMLLGDRVKFLILIFSIAFATLLMTLQLGIFVGIMNWTATILRTTRIPIWVTAPSVLQVNSPKDIPDTDLYRVRSVSGVKWALPLSFRLLQAKMYNGKYSTITLIGVDDTTLYGIPPTILKGRLEDLWQANSVIIDTRLAGLISPNHPLDVGDNLVINDHEVKVVAIVKGEQTISGGSTIYTPYSRMTLIAPQKRLMLSYILVEPRQGVDIDNLVKKITEDTGLKAFTRDGFYWSTVRWFFGHTAIPISILSAVILGFIIGIAVATQTFYSFIYENMSNFSALKAMGLNNNMLRKMILAQILIVGFIGYGIGLGVDAIFGFFTINQSRIPFSLTWTIPAATALLILLICLTSAYIGIRKVSEVDPEDVFRA